MFTIGHSTRTFDEFLALLREHEVTRLADIRRYPGSRRHPHFSKEALEVSLPEHGVEYVHFVELGGRRKPLPDSPNGALRNEQFRAYADYMSTAAFAAAVDRLVASEKTTAYMCAEAVPWRCHRNLLSDELVRRAVPVFHIINPGAAKAHELSRLATIDGERIIYAPPQKPLGFGGL
jgi:uncharacterized protein (DUF488 family)